MEELVYPIAIFVRDSAGVVYTVQVRGRPRADGMWEGRIEFLPTKGSVALVADDETEQSSRNDLEYWASGLSTTYLEGALTRAS